MSVWAVVVAAGTGVRFGTLKQYEHLGGRRVLDWALERTRAVTDGVVLVVPPERAGESEPGVDAVVAGSDTRAGSVRAGLAAVPHDAEVVVVHDAARPLASVELFQRVVDRVRAGADGAIPGVPLADTVKVVDDGTVIETLDRARRPRPSRRRRCAGPTKETPRAPTTPPSWKPSADGSSSFPARRPTPRSPPSTTWWSPAR